MKLSHTISRTWKGDARRTRLVLLGTFLTAALAWSAAVRPSVIDHKDPDEATKLTVHKALEKTGYTPSPQTASTKLLTASEGRWSQEEIALVRAIPPGGSHTDLIRVDLTRSPGGLPVRLGLPFNLTKTASAHEEIVYQKDATVLAKIHNQSGTLGLLALDFEGEPASLTATWSSLDQKKNLVSNWQETGQTAGLGRQQIRFAEPLRTLDLQEKAPLSLAWNEGTPHEGGMTLSRGLGAPPVFLGDPKTYSFQPQIKGERPHLGWLVDTVRDLSFVGPEKIAALEDYAFHKLDWIKRTRQDLQSDDLVEAPILAAATTPPKDLKRLENNAQGKGWQVAGTRPEHRIWPPKNGDPIFKDPGPGEGVWVPLQGLVKESFDQSTLFYQSWLRPDPERRFARVSVTAWDPSRLHLGVVAGTREPQSTTGLKGSGQIPRSPGLLPRVVAAFNGGFQTKHGPYGMISDQKELIPPAGDAATVSTTRDGQILLGTWPSNGEPKPPGRKSLKPGESAPDWVQSLRQNLEPLVAENKFNPFKRRKWGSTAGKNVDKSHTVRTGICLLEGGGLAYFFGSDVSAETLGKTMVAFHCDYGVHLDMNAGHSGFEFYNVKDDQGEDFEAHRMIAKMWHMNFPRYIKRDGRDFFYLYLRPQPSQRLQKLTESPWKIPQPSGTDPALLTSTEEPSQLMETTLPLEDGSSVRLYRTPIARTRTEIQPFRTLEEHAQGASLLISLAQPPQEGASKHQKPLEGHQRLLVASTDEDLFLAQIPPHQETLLKAWFKKAGTTLTASLNVPNQTRPALRFLHKEGKETLSGGPLQEEGGVLKISLEPSSFAGRLEDRF